MLLSALPREGDLTTIKIVRTLREDLSFSEGEHAALQFKEEGGLTKWRDGVVADKDIELGPKAMGVVATVLGDLNKQHKITEDHLSLCEKFGVGAED